MGNAPSISKLTAVRHVTPAGGGAFSLPSLAMGLFQVDQALHRLSIGSDRRALIPLNAGQGWILPAGASGLCEYDEPLNFLMVEVSESLLLDVGIEPGFNFQPLVGVIDPLLVHLASAAGTADVQSSFYVETMQLAFAARLAQTLAPARFEAARIEERRFRRVLDYIHANLATNLTLDDMASEAAMSRYHFVRSFAKTVGNSPMQYVIGERMKLAKVLLRTTHLPVATIALRVGYEDVSRFGQHFRRHAGTTPAAFRRNG